jgi:hypothetical protein
LFWKTKMFSISVVLKVLGVRFSGDIIWGDNEFCSTKRAYACTAILIYSLNNLIFKTHDSCTYWRQHGVTPITLFRLSSSTHISAYRKTKLNLKRFYIFSSRWKCDEKSDRATWEIGSVTTYHSICRDILLNRGFW